MYLSSPNLNKIIPSSMNCLVYQNGKPLANEIQGNTDILKTYEELGYKVYKRVLNSASFGSATKRERVIIVL